MGGAATLSLALRGARVLGIDRLTVPHDQGSSHGETRLTRLAYFEHPDYVPLLKTAHRLWRDREQRASERLFHQVGLCYFGKPDGAVLPGVQASAAQHQLRLEALPPTFPSFPTQHRWRSLFEPEAGFLRVEESLRAQQRLARAAGASWRWGERVASWRAVGTEVEIKTDRDSYLAPQVIFTVGAWSPGAAARLDWPIQVHRQIVSWFRPQRALSHDQPCFAFDVGDHFYYGFSPTTHGVKIADHTPGPVVPAPEKTDRQIYPADTEGLSRWVGETLPWLEPAPVKSSVCLYSMTPDGHFIIDRHPESERVWVAAGFSGHGFKFTPVIGEILADLVQIGSTGHPIPLFSGRRFSSKAL